MPNSTHSNTSKPQPLGCLGGILQEIFDGFISFILFLGAYLLFVVLLLFIADDSQSLRTLSAVGLFIISTALVFFLKAIQAQKNLAVQEAEAWRGQQYFDSWFFKTILEIQRFLYGYTSRKLYSLAGLAVSIASIFIDFLIEIGSGEFMGYFNRESWTTGRLIFSIAPFFLGILADWIRRKDSELLHPNFAARLLIIFGVLKFYPSILLFVTGLVGGNDAFLAAQALSDIASPEIVLLEWLPNSYAESNSHQLLVSLGPSLFLLFYLLVPGLIFWNTRKLKRTYEDAIYYQGNTPMAFVKTAYYISLAILLIPIYVGWHEGWAGALIALVLYLIMAIGSFLAEIF